jgi:hypothetical protein
VEAVPAHDHREAAVPAPHVNLARGWNTQVDMERGRLFYNGRFSATTYRAWLDRWALGIVVLPGAEADRPATVVRTSDAELEVRVPQCGSAWLHTAGGCLRKQGEFTGSPSTSLVCTGFPPDTSPESTAPNRPPSLRS